MSFRAAMTALRGDPTARVALVRALRSSGSTGYFWECAPSSRETVDAPFEFVVVDARGASFGAPDPSAFAAHLGKPGPVRTFSNLSGDALLVSPTPNPGATYGHLAAFLRDAPDDAIHALWAHVGKAMELWWSTREDHVWLSTAGMGVPWLHVRLDRTPKYYRTAAYRRSPGESSNSGRLG